MASNSEKKEQSLAEFVVIVALVGVMMAVFIKFFIKNEDQFMRAGFATVAQSFLTKVNAVHAQWMMDKQPNRVELASLNKEKKQAISVNKAGWIDVQTKKSACEKIWQLVMETPMSSMSFSVSAIEVYSTQYGLKNSQCRYVIRDGSYFQYERTNGKVSKVIELN